MKELKPRKEPMIRTNYYWPRSMLDRLKLAKSVTGMSVSKMMREAVNASLNDLGL